MHLFGSLRKMSRLILDDYEKASQVPITIRESWAWRLHIFLAVWVLILRISKHFPIPELREFVLLLFIAWPFLFFFLSEDIPILAVEKLTINHEGLEWHKGRKVRRIAWQHINAIVRNDISDGMGRGWGTTVQIRNEEDLVLGSVLAMKRDKLIGLIVEHSFLLTGKSPPVSGFDPGTIPKWRLEWATFLVIPVILIPLLFLFLIKRFSHGHS